MVVRPPVCSPTIYFVQTEPDGPVKIGYTRRRVGDRMAEGQTFNAQRILVLAETYGTRHEETLLHQRFRHLRIQGEWFRYGEEVRDLVLHLVEGGNLQSWLHT